MKTIYSLTQALTNQNNHNLNINITHRLHTSAKDEEIAQKLNTDPNNLKDDQYDYSKVVVKKPWGYEYLIYQNNSVAIWILYLNRGFYTSMHSHPHKMTSLTVLSGEVICSTLEEQHQKKKGDVMLIGAGVFHRSFAASDDVILMEIETSTNKRDLLRYQDGYGRERMGYENADYLRYDVNNYNYVSLIESNTYYNVKKRFKDLSIRLEVIEDTKSLQEFFRLKDWDQINIISGVTKNHKKNYRLGPGAILTQKDNLKELEELTIKDSLEVMIVNKSDSHQRLSEYIAHLIKENVDTVFFVPRTSNAHLVDAIARDTNMCSIPVETEQAAVMAAEGFSKLTGKVGVVIVSSGLSSIQALSGVANAWVDSVPLVIFSGQSRLSHLCTEEPKDLRQLYNKEVNIVKLSKSITKYSHLLTDVNEVKNSVHKAFQAATSKRQGPTWLDIPIDLLGKDINTSNQNPQKVSKDSPKSFTTETKIQIEEAFKLFRKAKRPVILLGHGVRAAGAIEATQLWLQSMKIPVLLSRRGADLLDHTFSNYFGRPGTYGQRAANFILKKTDCLICIGTRLSIPLVGRNYQSFAENAQKIVVDIDRQELEKATITANVAIELDALLFINEFRNLANKHPLFDLAPWIYECQRLKDEFSPSKETRQGEGVDPYLFMATLSQKLDKNDIIVVDGGPILDFVMQTFTCKKGQRIISSPGLECEGFALPGTLGACLGGGKQRVICLTSPRGLTGHQHILQTLKLFGFNVKIFMLGNNQDMSVQQVQATYFGQRFVGTKDYGAQNYSSMNSIDSNEHISTNTLETNSLKETLSKTLNTSKTTLCQVEIPKDCEIIPRIMHSVTSDGKWISKPLDEMYPYIEKSKLKAFGLID